MSFYQYFLATLDKHGIKVIEGFEYEDNDTSWAYVKDCKSPTNNPQ